MRALELKIRNIKIYAFVYFTFARPKCDVIIKPKDRTDLILIEIIQPKKMYTFC